MLKMLNRKIKIILAAAACSVATASAAQSVTFDIPAQSLADALVAVANRTDINVYIDRKLVAERTAPAIKGTLTPNEAFERLLAGTGLSYRFLDEHTVVLAKTGEQTTELRRVHRTLLEQQASVWSDSRLARADDALENPVQEPPESARDSVGLEEIVVTAQKREQTLQDVPMSITVKSGEELAKAGIKTLQDLSFIVPGLSVGEQGPGKQQVAIRGVSNYVGQFSLTGTYLDEMPITPLNSSSGGEASNGASVSPLDLERVEVLKGPQGTLFGEGAAGGVIRFITKDPDLTKFGGEFSGSLYSTQDGGGSHDVSAIVNIPVVEDVFGIRIVGAYEDLSGWIDTPAGLPAPTGFLNGDPSQPVTIGLPSVGRRNINDGTGKHVRVKALFTPTPQLKITALAQFDREDGGALNAVNMLPYEEGNYRQGVDLNAPSFYDVDGNMYNLTATYDFGFAELLSSTSYVDRDLLQAYGWASPEKPEPDLQVYLHGFIQKYETFNQEVRLTSAGEGPLHWTFGGVYKDANRINSFGVGYDLMLGGGHLSY